MSHCKSPWYCLQLQCKGILQIVIACAARTKEDFFQVILIFGLNIINSFFHNKKGQPRKISYFEIGSRPPEAMGGYMGDIKQPAANGGRIQKLTDVRLD